MPLERHRLLAALEAAFGVSADHAALAELERRLDALLRQAGASPPLAQGFLDHLAERVPTGMAADRLGEWQLEDLYLCYACLRGERRAVEGLLAEHRPTLAGALRRQRLSPALQAEALQSLEALLLTGDGERPPLLAQYSGLGRLGAWLRVVTARHGRRLLEREKHLLPLEDHHLADKLGGGSSPELAHLKRTYREPFREAFREAMRRLDPRQINLLRHRYLDGLTVTEVATIYRVHHSTVSRWISEARDHVLEETRRRLMASLRVSHEECASLVELLKSQLDITLSAFFEVDRRGADEGRG